MKEQVDSGASGPLVRGAGGAGERSIRDETGLALAVTDLKKVYGTGTVALRGVDLEVREGEFVTLLGPSGSGKTTLLMVIAGFEQADSGRVFAKNVDVTQVPPEHRNFGVVFQSYALFPHMSVSRNVAYPLRVRGIRGRRRNELVEGALQLVGLEGLGSRRPSQLSGGQQQRVALARALVYEPSVLLLDEPLGALDRALRERMQTELRNLHRTLGVTFLYVTHDQDEALTMSDRVVVLRHGQIVQVASPQDLYARPSTAFVANFVGTANLFGGQVMRVTRSLADVQLDCGPRLTVPCADGLSGPSRVLVLVRPENIALARLPHVIVDNAVELEGRIEREAFAGNVWRYELTTPAGDVRVHLRNRPDLGLGDRAFLQWHMGDSWALPDRGVEAMGPDRGG